MRSGAPRWPFALIFVGALAVVFVGGATVRALLLGGTPGGEAAWGPAIGLAITFGSVAVVSIVLVLAFGAYNRARLRHIRMLRPYAEIFTATRVDDFADGLTGIPASGAGVGTAFGVSIGVRGVELWRNASLEPPAYLLEWRDIAQITAGDATIRGRRGLTVSVPALHVTRADGAVLPLTVARQGSGYPAPADAVAALAARVQARIPRR